MAAGAVGPGSHTDAAYLFHRALRAQIPRTNQQDDATNELESVPQHEVFHFPVGNAAPMRPGQERPADFDRSEEHTSELQSLRHLVCRLLIEKKNKETRSRSPPVAGPAYIILKQSVNPS